MSVACSPRAARSRDSESPPCVEKKSLVWYLAGSQEGVWFHRLAPQLDPAAVEVHSVAAALDPAAAELDSAAVKVHLAAAALDPEVAEVDPAVAELDSRRQSRFGGGSTQIDGFGARFAGGGSPSGDDGNRIDDASAAHASTYALKRTLPVQDSQIGSSEILAQPATFSGNEARRAPTKRIAGEARRVPATDRSSPMSSCWSPFCPSPTSAWEVQCQVALMPDAGACASHVYQGRRRGRSTSADGAPAKVYNARPEMQAVQESKSGDGWPAAGLQSLRTRQRYSEGHNNMCAHPTHLLRWSASSTIAD